MGKLCVVMSELTAKNTCSTVDDLFPGLAPLVVQRTECIHFHAFNIYRDHGIDFYRVYEIEQIVSHNPHYHVPDTASNYRRRVSASEYHLICIWVYILTELIACTLFMSTFVYLTGNGSCAGTLKVPCIILPKQQGGAKQKFSLSVSSATKSL